MDYTLLGRTGVHVSRLCLGTMTFGNEADEATSFAIMDRAYEAGINFFDTANIYNKGVTEEIIGKWLPAKREEIVLASKVYYPTGKGINQRGSSRRHIMIEIEKSLDRLQTDWLDILYLHHWDANTDIEQSLAAVNALIDSGVVHYCGVSNFSAWQTMKAVAIAEKNGFAPITVHQPMYNLLKRQAEVEILPLALEEHVAVCPYSPMGAGLLTGKYQRGEKGRIDVNPMYAERYKNSQYRESSTRFVDYAKEHGYEPAALAVAWVNSHPAVTSAIVGMRNVDQLELALSSLDIELTTDQRAEISALSPEPPTATDRGHNEPLPVWKPRK